MGPLLLLLAVSLLGCSTTNTADLTAELNDNDIVSGSTTTLTVTVANNGETPLTGDIVVSAPDDQVTAEHPEEDLLTTTLYPDETVTRVFTINATTKTRRTDYEITTTFLTGENKTATTTNVLTVTRD